MRRIIAGILACAVLLGAAEPAAKQTSAFDILGASVNVSVERNGTTLPASQVPSLQSGDVIQISFPKGVQFSRAPRWHLVVANMYADYLQHPPTFAIPDANLSRAADGKTWSVTVQPDATPIIFLVPEDGSRYGRGLPDARAAISDISNRALVLKAAEVSSAAQAKASTLDVFLTSMASIQPNEVPDGRARVASATQSLFGSDLGDSTCFTSVVAQSTQYACAANAVASGYGKTPTIGVGAVIGDQLPIGTATYGMLIGTLYALLAKRRVTAHYTFVPGVIKPGSSDTSVYVAERLQYDATAAKPSTIVYFTVGSQAAGSKAASYGAVPQLPVCVAVHKVNLDVPFSGLPVYFRSHAVTLKTAAASFDLPATYDPVLGYTADLTAAQFSQLDGGAMGTITSDWGFDAVHTAPFTVIEPHPAKWTLQNDSEHLVSGNKASTLTFTDGGAGQGSCVQSIAVLDGLGHTVPVTKLDRTKDTVTLTLDASNAFGATGSAVVHQAGDLSATPVAVSVLPALPAITSAIAYLPKGVLVLRGSGLKYVNTVTLEHTGITFGSGTPNADGSWVFVAQNTPTYKAAWEHETMAIEFTLQPPDTRTDAVEADVQYAP
ncbi:MAG TPA: hypothetical protein VF741_01950, partial [Candidatus Aquilonibacter sp.]